MRRYCPIRILLTSGYGLGNQVLRTGLFNCLSRLGHQLIVVSEHVGIDAIAGHPAINALLKWYPGYDDSESQIEQYLKSLNLDLAIATAPVHGTAADRFLRHAPEAWSVGKIECWTRHEADVNLDYARRLGWDGTWEPSEFFVPDAIDTEVEQMVASRFADRPIIGLHFGCIKSH